MNRLSIIKYPIPTDLSRYFPHTSVLTIKVMFTLSRQSGFYSLYLLSNTFLSLSHKIPIARPHPF